jgi:hypothetical protein
MQNAKCMNGGLFVSIEPVHCIVHFRVAQFPLSPPGQGEFK